MDINQYLYHYQADVIQVHDGDTVTLKISIGFEIVMENRKIRLARINAPELSVPAGHISQACLQSLIGGKTIILQTIKDHTEKFGRYLGEIWVGPLNINDEMVRLGQAAYVHY